MTPSLPAVALLAYATLVVPHMSNGFDLSKSLAGLFRDARMAVECHE